MAVSPSSPELGEHEHYETRLGEPAQRRIVGSWDSSMGSWTTHVSGPCLPHLAQLAWGRVPGAPWDPSVRQAAVGAIVLSGPLETSMGRALREQQEQREQAAKPITSIGGHTE